MSKSWIKLKASHRVIRMRNRKSERERWKSILLVNQAFEDGCLDILKGLPSEIWKSKFV